MNEGGLAQISATTTTNTNSVGLSLLLPPSSRRGSVNQLTYDPINPNRRNSASKVPEIILDPDYLEKEREIKVTTALRLIREVAKTRSTKNIENKKKRTTYSIADEPQLILHNVESMKKDAQAAYHYKLRNTKDNGLIPAARPKQLRPISANMVSEIMISEEKRMEEEAQMLAIKQAKQKLLLEKQQAWALESPSPLTFPSSPSPEDELILDLIPPRSGRMTLSPGKSSEHFGYRDRDKKDKYDGQESMSISTATATATASSSVRRGTNKDNKSIPCQRKPSRRDTASGPKAKELQMLEESRRKSLIDDKKKKQIIPLSDTKIRQNFWIFAFIHLTRLRYMGCFLEENRLNAWTSFWKKREKRAVRVIEAFWRTYRLVLKIRNNPRLAMKVRICILIGWRKRKIAKMTSARNLVYQFLRDISGVSDRTQKVYRYRARVVKLQRYLRSYIQCQQARVLLLWLSFQKLLAKQRLLRNREIHTTERDAVRKMKRSKFFGQTVQKLDEVYTSLSTLMYQKNQVYKSLMQKQKHIEHLNTSGVHSPTNQKISHPSGMHGSQSSSYRNQYLHRAGGSKFHALLLNVLHNQRRRHILVHDSETGKNRSKTLERQAVDDADVKEFLRTPNHPGPNYVWNTISDSTSKKSDLFILLTAGGSRELDSVAYNLVIAEDHERKEKGSLCSGSGPRSLADLSSHPSLTFEGQRRVGGREVMEYLLDEEDD